MYIANLDLLAEAVTTAFGSRILNPKDAAKALAVYVHLATEAGFSAIEIRDSIGGCQLATIAHAALRGRTLHDRETDVLLIKVEAILELLQNGDRQMPDDPCDGAIAPVRIPANWWMQIVHTLGRELRETPDGLLECDPIIEAYNNSIAGQRIPSTVARTMHIPTEGGVLELCFRSLAYENYTYLDSTPSYQVVLESTLLDEDAA